MRKKLYLFPLFLVAICTLIASCSKNDDKEIDEEWKALNEVRFNQTAANSSYSELRSLSNNGSVYWKESKFINDESDDILRISPNGNPEFTDTVVVRYEGWYFDREGKKIIFDSTENPSLRSQIAYSLGAIGSPYPNKEPMQSPVNKTEQGYSFVDGFKTTLQYMKVSEEREVCIPQQLGYGATPSLYNDTYVLIPAYTTIWFNIKLLKIIPMNGLS